MGQSPKSIVLDLENLSSQYSSLLIEYEQAVSNYTSSIQSQYSPGSSKYLMNIPNNTFLGSGNLDSYVGGTAADCSALCLKNSKCTGATFNKKSGSCNLRSGEGTLIPSNNDALIPPETYHLLNMQSINTQLIDINQQILYLTTTSMPKFNMEYAEREVKSDDLLKNYIMLNEERNKINNMVKSFEELTQDEIQGNLSLSQNYYSFILLLVISVLLIVVIYMFSSKTSTSTTQTSIPTNQEGGQLGISVYFIIFAIICIILLVKNFSSISSFIKSF